MQRIGLSGVVALMVLALGCGGGSKSSPKDPNIIVSDVDGQTTEAGGTATLTVSLDGPPVDVLEVELASSNIQEGIAEPNVLVFDGSNWEMPQVVTITGVDDFIDDGDQTYQILIATTEESRDVINIDDDTAGVAAVAAGSSTTDECGSQEMLDYVLTSEPLDDVVISLMSSDETEGTIDVDTLTFTSGDWDVPQTVTVTGMNDTDADGDIAYAIQVVDIVSTDSLYSALSIPDVSLSNLDNEGNSVVLDAVERGWWNDLGNHSAGNNNMFTGFCSACSGDNFNSYVTFDLSGITTPVADVVLRLEVENYYGGDASEDVSIWDVTTDAASLEANGSGITAIFDDLQSGNSYGVHSVLAGAVGGVEDIPLNDQATIDINLAGAAGIPFSVGMHIDTLSGQATEGVRFASSSEARTDQLVLSSCQ